MVEGNSDGDPGQEKSFAEMFESYETGMGEGIEVGDKIRGEVISIGKDAVFVNTGTKTDGVVDRAELLDGNGELSCKAGDILDLFVISIGGDEIRLSRGISGAANLKVLRQAFEKSVPVEGKVRGQIKGGYQVDIMSRRAFCPMSQMDLKYVENPADHVGKTYQFLITQFEEGGKNIVLSRREILRVEFEKARKEFCDVLKVGDQVEGRVTRLMAYGAFVEIFPGLEGMVHISELSWSRAAKAGDVVKRGELVTVKVIGVEQGNKSGQMRISLSVKQVTGDPWERIEEKFHVGETITGKVTRCLDFGAFVEIAEGIEGLVHISEMSYIKRVLKPEEVVSVGETVSVVIKEIDPAKRRISLSIKEAEGDPWLAVAEKYKVGQSVEGTFEKKERFGYFIGLEPGVTGLLPKSKARESHTPDLMEKLKVGDRVSVLIEEIRPGDRRMTFGIADAADGADWRVLSRNDKKSFGSLGEKLQHALTAKKEE